MSDEYEKEAAAYEAERNRAWHSWFAARGDVSPSDEHTRIFDGGFRMAWEFCRAQLGAVPVCEPRKKKPGETPTETICRRLEEYIEYASNTKRFADVGFYQELIEALTATGGTE